MFNILIIYYRPTNSLNIESIVPVISNFPSTRARLLGLRQLFIEKLSAPKKQRSIVNCVQNGINLLHKYVYTYLSKCILLLFSSQ